MKDFTKANGVVELTLKDEYGNVKEHRIFKNLVVATGLAYIISRMANTSQNVMSHLAVGTDNTAALAGNTALGTEVGRAALTSTSPSGNTVVYQASFGAGVGTGALVEAGLFNAASSGTMLSRTTFPVVNKGAFDTLAISWTITLD